MIRQDSTFQDEVLKRVDIVAQKFQEIAPEAWEILVRQQVIEGYADAGLLVAAWVGVALLAIAWWRKAERDGSRNAEGVAITALVVGVVVGVITLVTGSTIVTHIANPEFHALMELKP